MSYIGNTNTTQAFTPAVDFFNGNGSTTAFTLSRPVASVAQVQAVISNVPQKPGDAFTVSGNTITFTSAPPSGTQNIYVYYTSPITQVIAPGQGTVTTTSLMDGSVTPAKMSSGAPSWTPSGGVTLPRIDSSNEGGQLNLNRSSDDTNAWALDVYGSGSTPAMRVLDLVNSAEIMRWNQSGTVILKGASTASTGVGITFPAAQSASSDANTLDDYEEGAWTPSLTFGGGSTGVTYQTNGRQGTYVKVGRNVTVSGYIYTLSTGSDTGNLVITGLPFAAGTSSSPTNMDYYYPFGARAGITVPSGSIPMSYVGPTDNYVSFYYTTVTTGGTPTRITKSNVSAGVIEISFQFSYMAAS